MRALSAAEPSSSSSTPTAPNSEIRSYRLDAARPHATAANADSRYERRESLERDLDRVQHSLNSERAAFGQQLNWLMLSQALLLNAYLLVLILGWSAPLPGKRLLLAGIAVFATAVAVLIMFALRGTRDAVMVLHQQRKALEAALHKDFGRTPVFVPHAQVTRGLASFANGLLPLTFVAGWIVVTLYTLAAPLGSTGKATAQADLATGRELVSQPAPPAPRAGDVQLAAGSATPATVRATASAGGFNW